MFLKTYEIVSQQMESISSNAAPVPSDLVEARGVEDFLMLGDSICLSQGRRKAFSRMFIEW